jgi:hypothetical protein
MTRPVLAILVAALTLGGCAGLPDSGPVERVAAVESRTHSTVRYEPARPRFGATPQQVVDGYFDAMLAYPEAAGVVQSYLTPRAVEKWRSAAGYTVYTHLTPKLEHVGRDEAKVAVRSRNVLTIDGAGRAKVEDASVNRTLRLERVGGEWRVDNPAPGYLVSRQFAHDYIRSYPMWFFDESGKRLVPEVAHSLVSDQLALSLVRRLAGGPRQSTLRTYLPSANDLRVAVTGKIVEIDFNGQPPGSADKVAAQLLSTLRGVPGLDGLRILVDGVPQGDVHPLDAVVGFGPGPLALRAYAIQRDRVVDVTNGSHPIAGPWGRSAGHAVGLAVDTSSVAAVQRGRASVTLGPRAGRGDVVTYPGTRLADPVWDDDHGLWLVDNPQGARVRWARNGEVREVATVSLGEVDSFAVSPDRARYAAVTRTDGRAAVVVGLIEHDADGAPTRLLSPTVVSMGRRGERSVGWASPSRVEFVAVGREGPQLRSVGLDGVDVAGGSSLSAGVAAWAGAAADRAERWALDGHGRLWRRASGGEWHHVGHGRYSALSSGR